MHSRKVFPAKDLNYAASKTSTTQNTATNPADLRDGAIGIYGIHRAGSTNLNKIALITDGGSESAGIVPMATFVGDQIFIAMGVGTGPSQLSNPIDKPGGIKSCKAKVYTAPVLGVWRVGYNGTSGSLNLPSTILRGDDFSISVTERNYKVSGNRESFLKKQYSVAAQANGETALSLVERWIAAVNLRPDDDVLFDKTKIKIVDNGTGSAFANTATVAAVNGATSLTTSAAHGVGVGDAVRLNGDFYVAVTGSASTTLVLDRPFQGPTGTIANANTLDLGVASTVTELGIELVDKKAGQNLFVGVDGILSNAARKQHVAPLIGAGTEAQVKAAEYEALPKKGSTDLITSYMPHDSLRASGTYDQYIFEVKNSNHPNGDPGSVFKVINYLTVAFPSGVADTTNFAQSDFEDILISLFGASVIPAIS